MRLTPLRADSLLFLVAVIWGVTFIAQRQAMVLEVPPLAFNGVRYLLGALTVAPLLFLSRRITPDSTATTHAATWRTLLLAGVLVGGAAALGAGFQQVGLVETEAGPAGFITGLYVIFTPMIGMLIGVRTSRATWFGAGIAVAGMWFLGVEPDPDGGLQFRGSDFLILLGAVAWAIQVQLLARFSPRLDPIQLVIAQFVGAAAFSFIASTALEGPSAAFGIAAMFRVAPWEIIFTGVFAIGVAFLLQVVAQRKSPPSHVAIILSLEAPIAALAGWLVLSESYGGRELLGFCLMMIGILVSQVPRMLGGKSLRE